MQFQWRAGVTCVAGRIIDDATGAEYRLTGCDRPLSPGDAVDLEGRLDGLVLARARIGARWVAYARSWRRRDWADGRRLASLYARRHRCTTVWRAGLAAAAITAPVAMTTLLCAAIAFTPLYVAGGFPAEIPIGWATTGLVLWSSTAVHEFAHASVGLAHRGVTYLERRGLTPSVLVRPVAGAWGVTHAVAGPLAGTAACVAADVVLDTPQLGLIAPAIGLVHLSNLSARAGDGRYLRAARRHRLRAPSCVTIDAASLGEPTPIGG